MDATRADHLACYGYERNTSPNLDRIAASGVLYEQAISAANWTLPSMASIFSGLYVAQHGTNSQHQFLEPRFTTMAEVFQQAGYRTALFSAGGWVSETFGMNRGFDERYDYLDRLPLMQRFSKRVTRVEKLLRMARTYLLGGTRGKMTYEMARDLRRWLGQGETAGEKPFFAIAHFGDPHWPLYYHPRHSFVTNGRKTPRLFAPDGIRHMAGERLLSEETLKLMVDYYDGEISFLDSYLGQLRDWMAARGLLDNTILVFTADHGEHLGDHGLVGHKLSVYESLVHVPLIISHPEHFAGGQRVSEPVQTIELFTTFLDVLQLDRGLVQQALPGRSLRPEAVRAQPWPVCVSENVLPNLRPFKRLTPNFDLRPFERDLRALRDNETGYKLIWTSDERHELYNLADDPAETVNLAGKEPERVRAMVARLQAWREQMETAAFEQLQPEMEEVLVQRLTDLGYL